MEDHKPPQSQAPPESKATMDSTSTTAEPTPASNIGSSTNTMQIDHRTNRTLLMAILHTFLRPFGPQITKMTCEYPPAPPNWTSPNTPQPAATSPSAKCTTSTSTT
jgi:hypothetical protein